MLPIPGYRLATPGTLYLRGTNGYYWSSSEVGMLGYYMNIDTLKVEMNSIQHPYGFSVRCVAE